MKKYAIYQRVSTEEQKQKGYSLEAMHERCVHFIKSQEEAVLVKTYEDAGFSGSLAPSRRPGMKLLLDDMRGNRGVFDAILVWKLDRLSRSLRDTLNLEFIFSKDNKSLESVTEKLDTSTAAGRMFFNTIASFAEFESAQTRERTFNAMSSKVGCRHLGGVSPIGYSLVKGKYHVVPHEADIVKELFRTYRRRRSFNSTAIAMNSKKLLTRKGKLWTHARVKEVLTNPVYIGRVAWHKTSRRHGRTPIEKWIISDAQTHDPIIRGEIFREVYETIKGRASRCSLS
jgi:site-specific DNA recombinase